MADYVNSGQINVKIQNTSGTAISGVNVNVVSTKVGVSSPPSKLTNGSGAADFSSLEDATYTVTPTKNGCIFVPLSASVTISDGNSKDQPFSATCNS